MRSRAWRESSASGTLFYFPGLQETGCIKSKSEGESKGIERKNMRYAKTEIIVRL